MEKTILALNKALREVIKPLRELQKDAEFDAKLILSEAMDKLIEAQGLLSDIQESYQNTVDKNEELSNKVIQYEKWTEDSSQYESYRLYSGATVVVSKTGQGHASNKEWFCKHCFDNKKKSQLQTVPQRWYSLNCPACKTMISIDEKDLHSRVRQ